MVKKNKDSNRGLGYLASVYKMERNEYKYSSNEYLRSHVVRSIETTKMQNTPILDLSKNLFYTKLRARALKNSNILE